MSHVGLADLVTDSDGERRMRQHPLFASMTDIGQVEFTVIPDDVMAILRSGRLVPKQDDKENHGHAARA